MATVVTTRPYPSLRRELSSARAITDHLFTVVAPQAMYNRAIAERHRIIFYLGHLEAFDWNQIGRATLGLPSFHPTFDKLFEFGIDPEVGKQPSDQPTDWPALQEIRMYNQRIRETLDAALDEAPEEMVQVALEHRLMHAETLAYMLHNLPPGDKVPELLPFYPQNRRIVPEMRAIPAGRATLGRQRGSGFGWDNEFEEHVEHVQAFEINKYKVTNGEYLNFVESGAPPPVFWTQVDGKWFLRLMFGIVPLPLDTPVYVTWDQATAYAEWNGGRLPSEAEFHRAAYGLPDGSETEYPWGNQPPRAEHGNFDFERWDPVAVDANPKGDSAFGVSQLVGNGYEWTGTAFAPFEGFRPIASYPGYSANFFDGEHFVLKGGSTRTAARLLRRSFRNWFRHNYPYMYAGFRVAR